MSHLESLLESSTSLVNIPTNLFLKLVPLCVIPIYISYHTLNSIHYSNIFNFRVCVCVCVSVANPPLLLLL